MTEKRSDDESEAPVEKHPSEMTSEEALDHLFHPEIARKAREEAGKPVPGGKARSSGHAAILSHWVRQVYHPGSLMPNVCSPRLYTGGISPPVPIRYSPGSPVNASAQMSPVSVAPPR